jgi:hypothetical protein
LLKQFMQQQNAWIWWKIIILMAKPGLILFDEGEGYQLKKYHFKHLNLRNSH